MAITLAIKNWFQQQLSPDELMLEYLSSHDNRALEKLYNSCADNLYHFVLSHTKADIAADICQKTWLKVIDNKEQYRANGQFKAWLFTMARHTLIDELRKQKHHQHEAIEQLAAPYNQAEDSLLNQFNLALQQLPFEQKEAFVLQQESFSLQQIADITHTEIETVKSRLRYAKNSLRQQLESYHD